MTAAISQARVSLHYGTDREITEHVAVSELVAFAASHGFEQQGAYADPKNTLTELPVFKGLRGPMFDSYGDAGTCYYECWETFRINSAG
ncbi:hypothetical protein GOB14_10020 [Sinorhizobium meliloti]|nr:hypothetical protein [Sinorhizobium meliloti]